MYIYMFIHKPLCILFNIGDRLPSVSTMFSAKFVTYINIYHISLDYEFVLNFTHTGDVHKLGLNMKLQKMLFLFICLNIFLLLSSLLNISYSLAIGLVVRPSLTNVKANILEVTYRAYIELQLCINQHLCRYVIVMCGNIFYISMESALINFIYYLLYTYVRHILQHVLRHVLELISHNNEWLPHDTIHVQCYLYLSHTCVCYLIYIYSNFKLLYCKKHYDNRTVNLNGPLWLPYIYLRKVHIKIRHFILEFVDSVLMICFLSVLEKLNHEYNVSKFTIVKLVNNNVYHCYY